MATAQWWVIYTSAANAVTAKVVSSVGTPKHNNSTQSVAGPYKTKALAQASISGYSTLGQIGLGIQSSGAPGSAAGGLIPSNATPGSLLGNLGIPTGRGIVLRLAEGALGVLLILVGVAKLAEGSPIASAIKKVPFL